jgi:hypothetical protein
MVSLDKLSFRLTGWVKAKDIFTIGIVVNLISFLLLVGLVMLAS